MRTSVEYLGDALEGILAGGIPNLELKQLLLQFDEERAKLDADSDLMIRHKLIVS